MRGNNTQSPTDKAKSSCLLLFFILVERLKIRLWFVLKVQTYCHLYFAKQENQQFVQEIIISLLLFWSYFFDVLKISKYLYTNV